MLLFKTYVTLILWPVLICYAFKIDKKVRILDLNDEADALNSCASLDSNLDHLTQEQFILKLTNPCRYDRLLKPSEPQPLPVHMQIDLRHIEAIDQLQFKAHMLIQYMYQDGRLEYKRISPNRSILLGEELLRNRIWVPHLIIRNERDSSIMGIDGRDASVTIHPAGDVIYAYRITANFYCWMNLQKFPFDSQDCDLRWTSWTYNSSFLILHWDRQLPARIATNLHLTEFELSGTWTAETEIHASFTRGAIGNFSELIFKFQLTREVGYYIMDYYVPSILLVSISWVTFWLQADASAPRVTLGTSTMLAFITLSGGLKKSLPKVSYIKASEIWFLGCAFFIFLSMAEFAFVNVIWRRRKEVELKKPSSKHILKGALTPSLARKQLRKAESSSNLYKTRSCSSLVSELGVGSASTGEVTFLKTLNVPKIRTEPTLSDTVVIEHTPDSENSSIKEGVATSWQTMSPHEVAIWIDKKSRIAFPLSFLIFNVFYWTFVYIL